MVFVSFFCFFCFFVLLHGSCLVKGDSWFFIIINIITIISIITILGECSGSE